MQKNSTIGILCTES